VVVVGNKRETFAARREAMGLTQESLADRMGVEPSTVGRWERGELTPQPWRRPRIAKALEVSLERLDELLTRGPADTSRRNRADEHPERGVMDADDAARFAREVVAARVSEATLDQVDGDVHRFAEEYVSRPLTELHCEIRQVRNHVFGLVRDNRHPNQMRRLYLSASRASGLQAHVCLDLGDYRAAHVHARTAFLCADLADHHGMRAWVRGLQSLIAYWDGRLSDAVEFARDGNRFPTSGSITARLSSLEARACAARGDRDGAVSALEQAGASRIESVGDDEVGVFAFPLAKQAVYAGTALLSLQDQAFAARAIEHSSTALDLYAAAQPADRSSGDMLAARLDLATAHLLRGDLDGLDTHLRVVLAVPQVRRTASILKRADGISERLARSRFASSRQGGQLTAEIAAFCAPAPSTATPA
jgi:transcriptional regulator with XRE-family HTH domain